jgi:hypothetical protein
MFLARIVGGRKPEVYTLTGSLHFPRAWCFMSYQRGAAAIGETPLAAIVAARQMHGRPAIRRIYVTTERGVEIVA